jgi:hypothetical protein
MKREKLAATNSRVVSNRFGGSVDRGILFIFHKRMDGI